MQAHFAVSAWFLFAGKGEATGNVVIVGWFAYGLLALRSAYQYAAKLRYICDMTKVMGKIVLREVGKDEMLNGWYMK